MKKIFVKEILMPTIVLTVICLVAALALSATHILTTDKIAENEKAKKIEAVQKVVPAKNYEEKSFEGATYYIATGAADDLVGLAFEGVAQGYGGEISVITGININGEILGVEIVSCADETPGLGQNVATDEFLGQFKGLSGEIVMGENADAWTGATISSKATAQAVNDALELFEKITKEGA